MNKDVRDIQVKVDTFGHDGREDIGFADAVIYKCNGDLFLQFTGSGSTPIEYEMMKMVALYLVGLI